MVVKGGEVMDERKRAIVALEKVGYYRNADQDHVWQRREGQCFETTALGAERARIGWNVAIKDIPALLAGGLTDDELESVEFGMNALMDLGFKRPAQVLDALRKRMGEAP